MLGTVKDTFDGTWTWTCLDIDGMVQCLPVTLTGDATSAVQNPNQDPAKTYI